MREAVEIGRPGNDEYAEYYARYVALAPGADPLVALDAQGGAVRAALAKVPAERERHRYGEGKWSIREVIGHLVDAERLFAYRALAFARGSDAALPSMEPDGWVSNADHDSVPLAELADEFAAVRAATLALFRHLPGAAWSRRGVASGAAVSVRALAFIIVGHTAHHLNVLRDRYGV